MLSILNESDFNVGHGLYAIKFWATWCGPCKVLNPTIERLDKEFENIKFLSVDIDQVPSLAQKYKIKSLPTLLLIEDGEEANRIIGVSLMGPMRASLRDLNKGHQLEQENVEILEHPAKTLAG